jgi:integrase
MAARKRVRNPAPAQPADAPSALAPIRPSATVAEFASAWLGTREPGQRQGDAQRLRAHVLPQLGTRRLRDIVAEDVAEMVRRTLGKKGMEVKTARNAYATFAEFLGAALERGLLTADPRELPAEIWPAAAPVVRPSFTDAEVLALTSDERLDPELRIYASLAFYGGISDAAICHLRMGQWREEFGVDIAAELAAALERWQQQGFQLAYGRPATAQDWLVPRHADVTQPQSEGSLYKSFRRGCVALGIAPRSPHAIRNTFERRSARRAGTAAP